MTWFKVDDDLAFHRKVVAAGNAAMGLWVRAGSWCAQHLTDGFIPDEMVGIMGSPAQRAKLIKVGLWIEVDGGCLFHQWSGKGRQPTAKEVLEKREAAADRQAEHRNNLYRNAQAKARSHAVTNTSVTEHVTPLITPTPTRPDPFSTSDEVEKSPTGDAAPAFDLVLIPNEPTTTNEIVAEWIRSCRSRPPSQTIGHTSKLIKKMLDEGISPQNIRGGLSRWRRKGAGPSALPGFVNEFMNRGGVTAPGDDRFTEGMNLAAKLEAEDARRASNDRRAIGGTA